MVELIPECFANSGYIKPLYELRRLVLLGLGMFNYLVLYTATWGSPASVRRTRIMMATRRKG
ncbi:hypothetical protein BDV11DRAFT_182185 [Aspergillus similis]